MREMPGPFPFNETLFVDGWMDLLFIYFIVLFVC